MTEQPTNPDFDFASVWRTVPNQAQIEATSTHDTIGHADVHEHDTGELPRVDHLVTFGEVLGLGGTGEVVAARQRSLERTIAVKRPRTTQLNAAARLLREARVIGYLEHPNIPPVHFVGATAARDLLVGLKHIEGETFTDRLARQRPLERLDENLEVLIQVCNAIGFAHSRGVLHLDLKPDNIMTGHYGEVYVLDWGLASPLADAAIPGLEPLAATTGVRGTPAFLAPEMITHDHLSPATDVYMLGGVLHYVLTHCPPHPGTTAVAAMQAAFEGVEPTFGPDVPAPLAAICRKALQRDPARRFADADQFRAALVDVRRAHREIEAMTTAHGQVDQLAAAIADREDEALVYQRYGAARQAVDEAARLQTAPDATRPLLQSLLRPMIEWELARENVGGAELLLAELPEPSPSLQGALDGLRLRRDRDAAELSALRVDMDPNVGRRSKVLFSSGIGCTIALLEIVPHLLGVPPTTERVVAGYAAYLVVLAVMTYGVRRTVLGTRTNRSMTLGIWVLSAFGMAVRLGAHAAILSLPAAISYDLVLVCLLGTYTGLIHDRRLLVGIPIYAVGTAATFAWPDLALVIFGTSHFFGLSAVASGIAYLPSDTRSTT